MDDQDIQFQSVQPERRYVGVKTCFMSGEVSAPQAPHDTHYYCGPSAKDIGAAANPRLWFKGFRTGMSEELFGTIRAIGE